MDRAGEVKTTGFELMLILVRILIFSGVVVLISGLGLLLQLPAGIAGGLAGLAGFALLMWLPLFEVDTVTCPHCGNSTRVVENFGTYQCPFCGRQFTIQKKYKKPRLSNQSLY
ncbi:MAG: transposase [Armatimonadetes bacterium]|nr:transposase [Armatimonadota bacterium]